MWFGPFDLVVGHSFGGAVVLHAIAGSVKGLRLAAERLVLISTPNAMTALFDHFADRIGLGGRSRAGLDDAVLRLTGTPLREFVGARKLTHLALPTLVLHAPEDREVTAADATELAGAGKHVTLRWIAGAGHRRIVSDARTLDAIVAFGCGTDAAAVFRLRSRRASAA